MKLHNRCRGPVIRNCTSDQLALPVWTKNRKQKIAVVNLNDYNVAIFNREFSVLYFPTFEDGRICAAESPVYKAEVVDFDLLKEKVEAVQKLIKVFR